MTFHIEKKFPVYLACAVCYKVALILTSSYCHYISKSLINFYLKITGNMWDRTCYLSNIRPTTNFGVLNNLIV